MIFETGTVSDGKWGTNLSGDDVINPQVDANNPSSDVLEFHANNSGGDLFGIQVNYASDPQFQTNGGFLTLSFDFLRTSTSGSGFIGTNHSSSGSSDEEWIWNNLGGGDFGGSNPTENTWTHITITFQPRDTGNLGTIGLKLEENSGTPETVFFDNIQLAAEVPEPGGVLYLALGLGAIAAPALRKRAQRS